MGILGEIWGGIKGFFGGDNEAQSLMKQQMAEYKKQMDLANSELAKKRELEKSEKRKLDAKQIRMLRSHFKGGGFLGSSGPDSDQLNNTTGA